MRDKRILAKILAGVVLVTGASLGATAPAQASDTGWGGTKIIKKDQTRYNSDTGWGGT